MPHARTPHGSEPLPASEREKLALLVEQRGETGTCRALRLNRQTLARALGGLGLRRGSRALITLRLRDLDNWNATGPNTPGSAA